MHDVRFWAIVALLACCGTYTLCLSIYNFTLRSADKPKGQPTLRGIVCAAVFVCDMCLLMTATHDNGGYVLWPGISVFAVATVVFGALCIMQKASLLTLSVSALGLSLHVATYRSGTLNFPYETLALCVVVGICTLAMYIKQKTA